MPTPVPTSASAAATNRGVVMPRPLDGIKIIDCSVYQNGPQSTVMLADMGAEAIKIEQPENGDPHRWGRWGIRMVWCGAEQNGPRHPGGRAGGGGEDRKKREGGWGAPRGGGGGGGAHKSGLDR